MRQLTRLWRAIESIPGLLDVPAWWEHFCGDEFPLIQPYLLHLIDLSIDIMTGIRLQPHTPKHLGGSNRTIIKQSFEMLVSGRAFALLNRIPTGPGCGHLVAHRARQLAINSQQGFEIRHLAAQRDAGP